MDAEPCPVFDQLVLGIIFRHLAQAEGPRWRPGVCAAVCRDWREAFFANIQPPQAIKVLTVIQLGPSEAAAKYHDNREAAVQAATRWARRRGRSVRCAELDIALLRGTQLDQPSIQEVLQALLNFCQTKLQALTLAVPVELRWTYLMGLVGATSHLTSLQLDYREKEWGGALEDLNHNAAEGR